MRFSYLGLYPSEEQPIAVEIKARWNSWVIFELLRPRAPVLRVILKCDCASCYIEKCGELYTTFPPPTLVQYRSSNRHMLSH